MGTTSEVPDYTADILAYLEGKQPSSRKGSISKQGTSRVILAVNEHLKKYPEITDWVDGRARTYDQSGPKPKRPTFTGPKYLNDIILHDIVFLKRARKMWLKNLTKTEIGERYDITPGVMERIIVRCQNLYGWFASIEQIYYARDFLKAHGQRPY